MKGQYEADKQTNLLVITQRTNNPDDGVENDGSQTSSKNTFVLAFFELLKEGTLSNQDHDYKKDKSQDCKRSLGPDIGNARVKKS